MQPSMLVRTRTSPTPDKLTQAKELVERLMGYHFQDDRRLLEAIDTTGLRVSQSNQRLALLGDVVLKHVLLDDWYPSGAGNALVSNVGSNANLAAVARNCDLGSCVITNPGQVGPVSAGTLSTTVEAILGALYLDCGKSMGTVRDAMIALGLQSGNGA